MILLFFKNHISEPTKKLKGKLSFFYHNRACFTFKIVENLFRPLFLPHLISPVLSQLELVIWTVIHKSLVLPTARAKLGKTLFQVYAPQKWNDLQRALKLNHLISLDSFKCLLFDVLQPECNCTLWSYCVCVFMYFVLRASLEKRACSQLTFPD